MNLIVSVNVAINVSFLKFLLGRDIETVPSAVATLLTSQAQATMPLLNPRGVQLNKKNALVPQGNAFSLVL